MKGGTVTGLGAHEIVGAYIDRFGWKRSLRGDDLDDLWGRLLLTAVHSLATWQPDGGRNRVSWVWQALHRDAGRWWAKHLEWRSLLDLPTVDWVEPHLVDDGYAQAEIRVDLQALADRVHLTDGQADAVAWWSVHGDTPVRHLGGYRRWFPEYSRSWPCGWTRGIEKLRAAA